MLAPRIAHWLLSRLIPVARNPTPYSDTQVKQVADSIVVFRFNAPILVDSNAAVLSGHCRLRAARQLGIEQVPVIVLDHDTGPTPFDGGRRKAAKR